MNRLTIPKVAVLATGLAIAMMAATVNPAPAQAFPNKQQDCTGCHGSGAPSGARTATPSTATPAAGAAYTVAITISANASAGDTGYWIANSTAAGATGTSTGVFGGYSGTSALTYSAAMTAPTAAGTYYYKVWSVNGSTSSAATESNFALYSITVAGAPVVVTTTTALGVTPASPAVAPASPTLKATVTGTGAAGTVEFFNGTTSLGTPTAISAGVASKTLSGIAQGSYAYKAVFTPTDAAAFTSSTSVVSNYLVNAAPPVVVTTTTALAVTPASPAVAPASPKLTATVSGAGAAGNVEFFDGITSLGTSPVTAGVASTTLSGIVAGSYAYKAVFTPTDAAAFTSSTSVVSNYVVNAAPPVIVTTSTALAVTPPTPAVAPAGLTLTATVSGAGAAGSVQFLSNGILIGAPIAVTNGVAVKALVAIGAGSYDYTAVFTPTDAAAFTSSTSLVSSYVVNAAPPVVVTTTTALAVTPASPAVAPASPKLTATVSGAGAAGSVEFFDGITSLGISPVVAGVASTTLSGIAAGSYDYTAVFTPTDAAAFTSSTSVVSTYLVTVAVPVPVTASISALSPNHGLVGDTVTINGSGFGTAGVVTFGDAVVTTTSWTDTAISFVIPDPAGSRSALVSVTPTGDVVSNLIKFRFEHVKVPRI